jgi:hypothetical protein
MDIRDYKTLIYKEAKERTDEEKRKDMLGGAAVVGGGATAKHMYDRGHLTGRESLYHNTDKKNVNSILNKGLDASHSTDPNNITNTVLGEIPMKDKAGKVYMGRKKKVADGVGLGAAQREVLKEKPHLAMDPLGATMEAAKKSKETRQTLKAKVPTWKMKEVDNPELKGSKNWKDFRKVLDEKSKNDINWNIAPDFAKDMTAKQSFNHLGRKGTATLEGNVGSEFFKGSKNFKKLDMSELKDYVGHNKSRFAKGVAGAAAGVGIAALGAKMLINNHKKEKKAEEYREMIYKVAYEYMYEL